MAASIPRKLQDGKGVLAAEAETLLVEAIPQLPPKPAATTRAMRFLVGFYNQWNRSQPDAARSARASEWRRRLESASGSTGR